MAQASFPAGSNRPETIEFGLIGIDACPTHVSIRYAVSLPDGSQVIAAAVVEKMNGRTAVRFPAPDVASDSVGLGVDAWDTRVRAAATEHLALLTAAAAFNAWRGTA